MHLQVKKLEWDPDLSHLSQVLYRSSQTHRTIGITVEESFVLSLSHNLKMWELPETERWRITEWWLFVGTPREFGFTKDRKKLIVWRPAQLSLRSFGSTGAMTPIRASLHFAPSASRQPRFTLHHRNFLCLGLEKISGATI